MSWNKWIIAFTVFAASQQATAATVDRCDTDCGFNFCDCEPCEGWSFYADWLYWKTRKADLDYVFELDINGFITASKDVCPGWDSGFRVGVLKQCGDIDFGLRYTYFSSDESSVTTNPNGFLGRTQLGDHYAETTDGVIEYAGGSYDLKFNQIDIEIGHPLAFTDCINGRVFAGFRFASIDQEFDVHYARSSSDIEGIEPQNPVDKVYKSNDMDFYGVYIGAQSTYTLSDCLDFFGSMSLGIGTAGFDRHFKIETNEGGAAFVNKVNFGDDCWRAVSVMDLNFGITYRLCSFLCGDWALSLGYEFHHWLNTADFISLNSGDTSGENHLDRHTDSLGFDGIFVRVSFAY